jgi:putative acetyltransferase
MYIRQETAGDLDAIRRINLEAFAQHPFSGQTEHLIVEALRASGTLELSLVAVSDDDVVGHIAFSPAPVGETATGWFLVGPVAVLPEHQRRGIGTALVGAGLERMRARSALGCVLVGDPSFYGRFGFRACEDAVYEGVPAEYLLSLSFAGEEPAGAVRADPAFTVPPTEDSPHAGDGAG